MTAKINDTNIKLKSIVPRVSKKLSVQRPPGQNSDAIEGLGSQGAELQIELLSDSLSEKHGITAEFLKTGPQVLTDPDGYIYNVVESRATGGRMYDKEPNKDQRWLYGFQCLMEEPYKYSTNQLIKSREIDTNNQEWDTDNLYYGNLLDNWSFEKWSSGTTSAPDGWLNSHCNSERVSSPTPIIGDHVVKIQADGTYSRINYRFSDIESLKGKYVTFAVWVYANYDNPNRCIIGITDAVNETNYSVPRDGNWHFANVMHYVDKSISSFNLRIYSNYSGHFDTSSTVYADAAVLIESSKYNETYHKSIEEYRLSGNYLDNWSFEKWSSGITSPPDGWTADGVSVERSNEHVVGNYGIRVTGTGSTGNWLDYQLNGDALDGKTVTFSCWVKSDHPVYINIRDDWIRGSNFHSGSGEWELLTVSKTWVKGTIYNEVRLQIPTNTDYVAYFDAAYLTLSSNYSSDYIDEVLPYGLVTSGTIDVIPDIEVVAGAKGSGYSIPAAIKEQEYLTQFFIPGTSYVLIYTETFSAVEGKAWKPVSTKFTVEKDLQDPVLNIDVRIYAAGINGGVELSVYTATLGTGEYGPKTFEYTIPTEYISDGNTNLEIRYYGRIGDWSGLIDDIYSTAQLVGSNIVQDVEIYNTADTTRKVQVCNEIPPGTTVNINKNGTGSLNYPEDFTTDTYKYVSNDYNNITYDSGNGRITLAAVDGYLIYLVDCKYPITGIPTLKLDIRSGPVKIAIADDIGGAPGTYYDIDDLTTTSYSSETVTFLLDSLNNYRLKGETSFFLKIYTDGATALVLNSLELDTDLVTIDALLPKIYHGVPNTFRADQNADSSLNATVTLSYRDGHWVI